MDRISERLLLLLPVVALCTCLVACRTAPLAPEEDQLLDTMSTPRRPGAARTSVVEAGADASEPDAGTTGDETAAADTPDAGDTVDEPDGTDGTGTPDDATETGESGETGDTVDEPGDGTVPDDTGTTPDDTTDADSGDAGDTGDSDTEAEPEPLIPDLADLPKGKYGVPPIPQPTEPQPVLVDENRIFATVNGEVISSRDVRRDIERYLDNLRAAGRASAFNAGNSRFNLTEWNELRQNFRRKALQLLYRQEAESLRKRGLGSIPREMIEQAIDDARQRHGVRGHTKEDDEKWRLLLQRNNMTHFDFERQIRDQLEAQRVFQIYAYHPEFRLGVSFDVSPAEMRREYEKNPIRATTDVVIHVVRFPLLVDSGEEREKQEKRATDFADELKGEFARIDRTVSAGVEANEARREAFVRLASRYSPDFDPEPWKLDNLNDDDVADYAAEIRRTRVGQASRMIPIPRKEIVVVFVADKKQGGYEPFSSPAVQNELSRRLRNQRWNDFQSMVDRELIDKSTIISAEAGNLDND